MAEFRVHHIRFFEYTPKAIHCLTYEPQTQRVALSRSDGSIEIWSIPDNWFQEKVIPALPNQSVEALVWQGKQLYSAGLTGYVTKYNLQQLKPEKTCSSNAGPIWCLVTSSSHKKLAAGTEDGCVILFDTKHGQLEYLRAFDKQEGRIFCIAWHVDEEVIVTGEADSIRLWSVKSGHAIQRLTLGRQEKNRETIVWCIAITSDMTIISGDSRGKTCFWNGRQGTLIMGAQSHKADVLCLDVSPAEDSVFTSGIDPSVVQFELTSVGVDNEKKAWVSSTIRNQHTHDVRAVLVAGKYLVSGGEDTNLITNLVEKSKGMKSRIRYSGFPHRSSIHMAKNVNIIMWNDLTSIELWKLGNTDKTSDTNGDILPLISKPLKLVCLKCKEGEIIVCSAISAEGNIVAYSEQKTIRINRLTVDDKEFIAPKLSLTKVRVPVGLHPAHHMILTSDGSLLITATFEGSIQLIEVGQDEALLKCTFPSENQEPISLLQVSPDARRVAATYEGGQLCVYNIQENKIVCQLPKYNYQATAMAFSPDSDELVVAYADQMIFEYDMTCGEYTAWCKLNKNKFPQQWKKRHSKICHLSYNPRNAHQILLHDEQMFCILDKSVPMSGKDERLYSKSNWSQQGYSRMDNRAKTLSVCSKYKFLLFLDTLVDDWLVAVERTPSSLTELLPPVLGLKKFGT